MEGLWGELPRKSVHKGDFLTCLLLPFGFSADVVLLLGVFPEVVGTTMVAHGWEYSGAQCPRVRILTDAEQFMTVPHNEFARISHDCVLHKYKAFFHCFNKCAQFPRNESSLWSGRLFQYIVKSPSSPLKEAVSMPVLPVAYQSPACHPRISPRGLHLVFTIILCVHINILVGVYFKCSSRKK